MTITILDFKLLSIEEALKLDKDTRMIKGNWWLRTPGHLNYIETFVYSNGDINRIGKYIKSRFKVRPAFYLKDNVGRQFKLSNHYWINVFDNVYLCKDFISDQIFSHDSNNYKESNISNYLTYWFIHNNLELNTSITLEDKEE